MTIARRTGLVLMLVSSAFSVLFALALQRTPHSGIVDFKIVYLGARCLVEHHDPYDESQVQQVFEAEGGKVPADPIERLKFQRALMTSVYLPNALLCLAPFAMLGWATAYSLWTTLTVILLTLAACLMWQVAADRAPVVSACLLGFMLANTEVLFAYGNAAGVAIGLCAVAVWCFLKQRLPWIGVVCLAISLAIKPHDSAFVWLYLFLAGGIFRKRAIQTVLVVLVLSLPAIVWAYNVAPNWMQEVRSNLQLVSVRGGSSDPGPSGIGNGTGGGIIDLQSAISVFRDDPRTYNLVTYIVCAPLFIGWVLAILRTPSTQVRAWLALATMAALSMLPIYHRPYDAKLLMLAVPACAVLWADRGYRGWMALLTTFSAILLSSDIPITMLVAFGRTLPRYPTSISKQILVVVATRPIPLVLLAMSIFYLWIYLREPSAGLKAASPEGNSDAFPSTQ